MTDKSENSFFDVTSASAFYHLIKNSALELSRSKFKSAERLIFVIMGLNHLREWIAPGYRKENKAKTSAESFFLDIYKLPEFRIVNSLCNSSKHLSIHKETIEAIGGVSFDKWESVDSVVDFDIGPPVSYVVDGKDIIDIIYKVIDFYEENWFKKNLQ